MAKLSNLVKEKIKEEIINDPVGRGYAGKTDDEVMQLLNEPYEVDVVVIEQRPARINQILLGIADTPNVITADDVFDAQSS
jgi:hypothetical protein